MSDDIKITILVDNLAGDGMATEHGLSLLIEADNRRILFDTGQGGALSPNAEKIGVDLGRIDTLVLSHGHYDHTGGISRVYHCAPKIDLYCHPAAVLPRYSIRDGKPKNLGMPKDALRTVDRFPSSRLHWVSKTVFLSPGIGLTGPIPRKTDYEDTGEPFFLDPGGNRPDPVEDDMALWIRTPKGPIVCVGCCHSGVVNTLRHVCSLDGASGIRAVIGGFHLLHADSPRIERTLESLRFLSPELIVPCHCTGDRVVQTMIGALGDLVKPGRAGAVYLF